MSLTPLVEITYSESPQVDREAGVIRGVRILGRSSRNGREYSDAALRQAARLYEGLGVNLNHPAGTRPDGSRSVEEGIGWLEAIDVRADGVYGDLHYFRAHPAADVIVEAAVRNPRRFGLSHHAEGSVVRKQGRLVVESIETVRSVDIVQNPATSHGLFESENPNVNRTVQEIFEEAGGPLAELLSSSPRPEAAARQVTLSEAAEPEEQVACALQSLLVHLLEDERIETAERLRQAGRWLEAHSESAGRATDDEGPSLEELTERFERFETESRCRMLLAERNRTFDAERLEQLAGLATDEERLELIESWPERDTDRRRSRPGTSRPLLEGHDELLRFPEDTRSFVAAIR